MKYWITVSVCGSAFYFFAVLLSLALGDQLRLGVGMLGAVALYGMLSLKQVPRWLDIFRGMGGDSPLFTHTLPWANMGLSLGIAAILFLIACRAVQAQEY